MSRADSTMSRADSTMTATTPTIFLTFGAKLDLLLSSIIRSTSSTIKDNVNPYVLVFSSLQKDIISLVDDKKQKLLPEALDEEEIRLLRRDLSRFYGGLERLKLRSSDDDIPGCEAAYSEMSVSFDAFLRRAKVGPYNNSENFADDDGNFEDLYEDYRESIIYERVGKGVGEGSRPGGRFGEAVKSDFGDLIVLLKGPNVGRTGIDIGGITVMNVTEEAGAMPTKYRAIKLDLLSKSEAIRRVTLAPEKSVGRRLGEVNPDEVFLQAEEERKKMRRRRGRSEKNKRSNNKWGVFLFCFLISVNC